MCMMWLQHIERNSIVCGTDSFRRVYRMSGQKCALVTRTQEFVQTSDNGKKSGRGELKKESLENEGIGYFIPTHTAQWVGRNL